MAGQWEFRTRNLTPAEAQAMRNDPRYQLVGESRGVEATASDAVEVVEHPIRAVERFILKHAGELIRDARRDPSVQKRVRALVAKGQTDAAARVYEAYYTKRVKDALGPWNWF